jgi:alpha-galactosidase
MRPRHLAPALLLAASVAAARADTAAVTDLGVDHVTQDFGKPAADKTVEGHPLTIGGRVFAHGLGTHAASTWSLDLHGSAQRLTASVGMDDEVRGSPDVGRFGIAFTVVGDGKTLFSSGLMHAGDAAKPVDVDLHGVKQLVLAAEPTASEITFCHADWADLAITYDGEKPTTTAMPAEPAEVLTPPPAATPRINSAAAFGVRPGHPVLYTVVATGDKPITFAADGLPDGVTLDPATGRLSGSAAKAGTYAVTLHATNAKGSATKSLSFVVGDKIALTPPMGWNSWNCFASNVSQEKVQAAADAMVTSGLIDHGWTYVNVDDCWEVRANSPADQRRAPDGHILTNKKFPDMKAMADYIHAKGLRAGLYSSPGPATCGGYTASYQHEVDDAHQYAAWGFDYLKYDWCSYGTIAKQLKPGFDQGGQLGVYEHPYAVMRDALLAQDRDILYSFCQYGMGDVWKWGEQFGGNCWRTTGDINDSWGSMAGIGFKQSDHAPYAGPGHWNDPDMLVVGKVGWGPKLHPTKLTPNEQYTHITLWSLLSAPLLIGCDMTQMDPFTFGLLSNDEVIAVNQDPLGKQATMVWKSPDAGGAVEAWARPLSDGSTAVGIFNRGAVAAAATVKWSDLHLGGSFTARDLWRQQPVAADADGLPSQSIARHGCVMLKLTPAK